VVPKICARTNSAMVDEAENGDTGGFDCCCLFFAGVAEGLLMRIDGREGS
jgi:hypothetical protein